VGLGLGFYFYKKIQLYLKFPLINIRGSSICRSPCGQPNAAVCCKACGSVGINPGFPAVGLGIPFLDVALHVDVQAQLKWCYNWGTCPRNGFAIGFCAQTDLLLSGSVGIVGGVIPLYSDFACTMLAGTQGMLQE